MRPIRNWAPILFILILSLCFIILNQMIGDWGRASGGFRNLALFFEESLWPPDWSVVEPRSYPPCDSGELTDFTCSPAWIGIIETIRIALVSTVFGMSISLPIAILAARNISPGWVSFSARIILAASRSLPSLIWAIFFVILVGFGPFAGVLAMTIYTVGYLGKLQYEAIEGMDSTPLESANSMGLSKIETSIGIVIPESANSLISQAIFMFEYNVRHGTVIGIVGAGGIGYEIKNNLSFLQYDRVFAYLLIIFVVVILIDLLSIYARSFFTEESDIDRPTWGGVFLPAAWNQGE